MNKPITLEKMKAYVDATWKKCQAKAWGEPVAKYSDIVSDGGMDPRNKYDTASPKRKPLTQDLQAPLTLNGVALYPRQQPLSDEEIQAIWAKTFEFGSSPNTFARAIEAAHNIKE